MKVEAYVLVMPGIEPLVSSKPWATQGTPSAKWYKLTAEVPDAIPSETVEAVAEEAK